MIKVAFGSVPKDGGTFTFYRNMRPALFSLGIDLRCVSIGQDQSYLWEDTYADDGCILLAARTANLKKQALAFNDWCTSEAIDIVIGINSEAILSALPHLPAHIRAMSRCANSFDHGYKITLSGYQRLAKIIAQTPRQLDDLITIYDCDSNKIEVIPNGIETTPFDNLSRTINPSAPLRLGFLGRLEHSQKGIFYLPKIVDELSQRGVKFQLTIAGKGQHEDALKQAFAKSDHSHSVTFCGALPPKDIPNFLSNIDVLLFPSRFEGCPNVLIEAMMSGCVPISWRLKGITDFIIEHDQSGMLCEFEDYAEFASHIQELDSNRTKLGSISACAMLETRERFASAVAARAYGRVFKDVMKKPAPQWSPIPWSAFTPDQNFPITWKRYIHPKLRNRLKHLLRRVKNMSEA